MQENHLSKFLNSVIEATQAILSGSDKGESLETGDPAEELANTCANLVSHPGEAYALALAENILNNYRLMGTEDKNLFFKKLASDFDVDLMAVDLVLNAYLTDSRHKTLQDIREALTSPRTVLLSRLNMVPGATQHLVAMRGDLLSMLKSSPGLRAIDDEFQYLLSHWFNQGFLNLQLIDWSSPASVLEKLIEYEAVHEIKGWGDLRSRLKEDRRLFAYFHPAMPGNPLIFVQVALSKGSPMRIEPLISADRQTTDPLLADTATFYSISNCHRGLSGISFGNFLIKQVASVMQAEFPRLDRFETLSPVPGFRAWTEKLLRTESDHGSTNPLIERARTYLADLEPEIISSPLIEETLCQLCAYYLVKEKRHSQPIDPVARFHLGNGAMLSKILFDADLSKTGLNRSYGIMVNYVYELDEIETRHENFATYGTIVAAMEVENLANA